jgi:hypothetical protein
MAPRGFPLKHYLGLEGSLQGWMGGLVHEEAFPSTSKVNLKVGQAKGQSPRTSYLNA